MKVVITMELDVDQTAWDQTYGTGDRLENVRPDVKTYVLGSVQDSAAAQEGCIREVKVRTR